jgi:hypothetical protein
VFWKKKDKTPKNIERYTKGDIEITRVRTSKPILPAKPGIKIDNLKSNK